MILDNNSIFFQEDWESFYKKIQNANFSSFVILTDDNCQKYCLPYFLKMFPQLADAEIVVIPNGDINKNIINLEKVWSKLLKTADRKSLLINLGGGMICDLGGFAASTFKRGIKFLNIPTSLLAIVDAAIGGKTAINYENYKNQIGSFSQAFAILVLPEFLKTLPENEKLSGIAEILKVATISNKNLFSLISEKNDWHTIISQDIIKQAIIAKLTIVQEDPFESGKRKLLNFGHTIGHAFETFSMENDKHPISHGQAVAIGMACETNISLQLSFISRNEHDIIIAIIRRFFPKYLFPLNSLNALIAFMEKDKKNVDGKINFSIPQSISCGLLDIYPTENMIQKSIEFYYSL